MRRSVTFNTRTENYNYVMELWKQWKPTFLAKDGKYLNNGTVCVWNAYDLYRNLFISSKQNSCLKITVPVYILGTVFMKIPQQSQHVVTAIFIIETVISFWPLIKFHQKKIIKLQQIEQRVLQNRQPPNELTPWQQNPKFNTAVSYANPTGPNPDPVPPTSQAWHLISAYSFSQSEHNPSCTSTVQTAEPILVL